MLESTVHYPSSSRGALFSLCKAQGGHNLPFGRIELFWSPTIRGKANCQPALSDLSLA